MATASVSTPWKARYGITSAADERKPLWRDRRRIRIVIGVDRDLRKDARYLRAPDTYAARLPLVPSNADSSTSRKRAE